MVKHLQHGASVSIAVVFCLRTVVVVVGLQTLPGFERLVRATFARVCVLFDDVVNVLL